MQHRFLYKNWLDKLIYKYNKTFFKPYLHNVYISKYQFQIEIGNAEADLWYGKNKYEFAVWPQLEFDVIIRNVKPGDIVFDIGCHQGIWLLLFSNLVGPSGKVYGFDTSSSNLAAAKKNLSLNGTSNITLENVCASNSDSIVKVATDSTGVQQYSLNKNIETVELRSVKIDTYATENQVYPTVVKVDVEGYEREVLGGMKEVLSKKPNIFIELHNFKFENKLEYVTQSLKLIPRLSEYKVCFQKINGGDIEYRDIWDDSLFSVFSDYDNPHLYFY